MKYPFLFFSACFVALTAFVADNSFFWDTIQFASKHGHWFYENGITIKNLVLPNEFDSGNPPFFGIYIASMWMIFGKSLAVSHFSMLPFLLAVAYQLKQTTQHFFKQREIFPVMLLVIAEATLLGQSALVSPDIALVFFYLLCINAILNTKKTLLFIGLLGLSAISMRGGVLVFAILMIDFFISLSCSGNKNTFQIFKNILPVYVPVLVLELIWYSWHHYKTGWTAYHAGSPWASGFALNSGWRDYYQSVKMLFYVLFDYGKISVWIIALWLLLKKRVFLNDQANENSNLRKLLLLLIVPLAVMLPSKLIYFGLMQSRYYLPVFIFLIFLACFLISQIKSIILKRSLYFIMLLSLASGHFWVYPERISQNWDGTLAHLPYYGLRRQMMDYIDKEEIQYKDIASEFPNVSEIKYTDLKDDPRKFVQKERDQTRRHKYIFYSNIINGFTVAELDDLHKNWIIEKEFTSPTVYVRLYKNPEIP